MPSQGLASGSRFEPQIEQRCAVVKVEQSQRATAAPLGADPVGLGTGLGQPSGGYLLVDRGRSRRSTRVERPGMLAQEAGNRVRVTVADGLDIHTRRWRTGNFHNSILPDHAEPRVGGHRSWLGLPWRLTALGFSATALAEEPLQADLGVALGEEGLDGLALEAAGEGQDLLDDLVQVDHLAFEALDFGLLRSGQNLLAPAGEWFVVEPQVSRGVAVDPLDTGDGVVIEAVGRTSASASVRYWSRPASSCPSISSAIVPTALTGCQLGSWSALTLRPLRAGRGGDRSPRAAR